MNTIYITESMANEIKVERQSFSPEISDAILKGTTPLSHNPSIPDVSDTPYLLKMATKRFEKFAASRYSNPEERLARLIKDCQEKERPMRDALEKICFNYVVDLFNIPEDSIHISVELHDDVDINSSVISLDPEDGEMDAADIYDARSINDEIHKRRILDALCMGGAMSISENVDSYASLISSIDPSLPKMYEEFIILNNYLLFNKEDLGLTDENKMQLGTVEVTLGQCEEKVKVRAQGAIFPVLLSETIRGFMELFVSHGLPKDRTRAMAVLGNADYLKAEPWDMRIGPEIWRMFGAAVEDVNSQELPYLLKCISSLSVTSFSEFMQEVLCGTRRGKKLMRMAVRKAKRDIDYDDFADKMDKKDINKGIITDDYIHSNEL